VVWQKLKDYGTSGLVTAQKESEWKHEWRILWVKREEENQGHKVLTAATRDSGEDVQVFTKNGTLIKAIEVSNLSAPYSPKGKLGKPDGWINPKALERWIGNLNRLGVLFPWIEKWLYISYPSNLLNPKTNGREGWVQKVCSSGIKVRVFNRPTVESDVA
jgi:hypothetical protein